MKHTKKIIAAALFACSLICSDTAMGDIVTTGTAPPAAGDYAADASANVSENNLQFAIGRSWVGQSFTLGTTGQPGYEFNSISFLVSDRGQIDEPGTNLSLEIYEGQGPEDNSATLLQSFAVTTTTFDTSVGGSYVTFQLSAAESAALGELDAGTQYSAGVAFEAGNTTDFRIRRSNNDSNAGGAALWDERIFDGVSETGNFDTVFQVNVTQVAVPEPSSLALIGLGAMGLVARRRRK